MAASRPRSLLGVVLGAALLAGCPWIGFGAHYGQGAPGGPPTADDGSDDGIPTDPPPDPVGTQPGTDDPPAPDTVDTAAACDGNGLVDVRTYPSEWLLVACPDTFTEIRMHLDGYTDVQFERPADDVSCENVVRISLSGSPFQIPTPCDSSVHLGQTAALEWFVVTTRESAPFAYTLTFDAY